MLLAAGSSTRLGKPKQLLTFNGKSLLRHSIEVAEGANMQALMTVLGGNADLLMPEIDSNNTLVVINKSWKDGMASSIIAGLTALLEKYPDTERVIFMMCDQPFVTTSLLNNLLVTEQQTGKSIVASIYDGVMGVPALFYKSHFKELLQLQGDTGARKIIQQHINEVATLLFTKGKVDIDTAKDYENLLKENK